MNLVGIHQPRSTGGSILYNVKVANYDRMFSFFKKAVSSILPWISDVTIEDLKEDEREIIDRINCMNINDEFIPEDVKSKEPLGQSETEEYEIETFKQVRKTGRVTHLHKDYGIIDHVIYFEASQVSTDLVLKPNDEVVYSAYKIKENEADRVFKIYGLKNDPWKFDCTEESDSKLCDTQDVKEIYAIDRVITGRVTEKRGQRVYVESVNIWCNLDVIQTSYIPVEGDWIELHALVSISKNSADLSGEILKIKSLKPLLLKNGFGRISYWSDMKKEGAIENLIYFTIISCENGYIPHLGDEVFYEAVESDQEKFRWRALKVLINNTLLESSDTNNKENRSLKKISDSFCDKNGISIVPSVCSMEIRLNQSKNVTFEIINNGTVEQFLKYTKFQVRQNSQLVLLNPKLSDNFVIQPKQRILYQFQCEGKILGMSGEVFFFYFKDFMIARRFEINVVGNKEMNKLLECKFDTVFKDFKGKRTIKSDTDADVVLHGPRPWKPPKFLPKERRCVFHIPKELWSIVVENFTVIKSFQALMNYGPFLKKDLQFECYTNRFHTLLYLEEIELKLNFRNFDLNGVFLTRRNDYFIINHLSLIEKRPSVIIGDKVILTQARNETSKTKHIGYIHHIRGEEIYLKFHSNFHENYDNSECDIIFEPNINFFTRCHEAINRAVKILGEQWLFPSVMNEKPPKIDIDIPKESETLSENITDFFKQIPMNQIVKKPDIVSQKVTEVEFDMKNEFNHLTNNQFDRNLVFVNKNLNDRQKLAVVNVLEGRGRPLPYIIFGPPGTGKTLTLVEIIIQIYRLLPESRILVTSSSNSSADLICERLIEAGNFKPGELVRMVAIYRVINGLVPAKLIPYSTVFNGRDTIGINQLEDFNFNSSVISSLTSALSGRQRITIATCVTVGVLHYLGFQPGHFTHIVVDEAGQCSEPEVLISTTFQNTPNGQVILTGDPQQLGPVVFSKIAKVLGLGISLLQRLISLFPYASDFNNFPDTSGFNPRFITKLNVNYRSVPEILSLPSQLFYNSDLISAVSQTDSEEARIIEKFNFEVENRSTPPAIIFHGLVGQNYQESDSPSWFNPHEIWQVVFYVRKLYSIGLESKDLGIVSPYAKQVHKLKTLLSALGLSQPKIGSVEEFQGQERYVIILTSVRSSYKFLSSDIKHYLGFIASPQRLNVALTRARALLIIVGNPILLSEDPYWRNVIKYCVKNNSYTGCSLHSLNKFVEDEDSISNQEETEKTTNDHSSESYEGY